MEDAELLHSHEGALPENVLSIAREFWAGFAAVDKIDRPSVSVFGSARATEDSQVYAAARTVGRDGGRRAAEPGAPMGKVNRMQAPVPSGGSTA